MTDQDRVSTLESKATSRAKGIKWGDGIEDALKKISQPNISQNVIQLTIDTDAEELQLAPETTLNLPVNDAKFAFANVDNKICFVYSCPPTQNVRTRFIYSASVLKIVNHAKNIGIDVVKRIETSNPEEITVDYLRSKLTSVD